MMKATTRDHHLFGPSVVSSISMPPWGHVSNLVNQCCPAIPTLLSLRPLRVAVLEHTFSYHT